MYFESSINVYVQTWLETFQLLWINVWLYSYLSCYSNVDSVTFITIVYFRQCWIMKGSTEELDGIFKMKIIIVCCIYTLRSLYISITENIYINSIYFAVIACETTLTGLINSNQKHIDVGPTRTAMWVIVIIITYITFRLCLNILKFQSKFYWTFSIYFILEMSAVVIETL